MSSLDRISQLSFSDQLEAYNTIFDKLSQIEREEIRINFLNHPDAIFRQPLTYQIVFFTKFSNNREVMETFPYLPTMQNIIDSISFPVISVIEKLLLSKLSKLMSINEYINDHELSVIILNKIFELIVANKDIVNSSLKEKISKKLMQLTGRLPNVRTYYNELFPTTKNKKRSEEEEEEMMVEEQEQEQEKPRKKYRSFVHPSIGRTQTEENKRYIYNLPPLEPEQEYMEK